MLVDLQLTMEQYIFNTAAIKCLCISTNYLHIKLGCKRNIRSYCKLAMQHCNVSDATLSRPCSTAADHWNAGLQTLAGCPALAIYAH